MPNGAAANSRVQGALQGQGGLQQLVQGGVPGTFTAPQPGLSQLAQALPSSGFGGAVRTGVAGIAAGQAQSRANAATKELNDFIESAEGQPSLGELGQKLMEVGTRHNMPRLVERGRALREQVGDETRMIVRENDVFRLNSVDGTMEKIAELPQRMDPENLGRMRLRGGGFLFFDAKKALQDIREGVNPIESGSVFVQAGEGEDSFMSELNRAIDKAKEKGNVPEAPEEGEGGEGLISRVKNWLFSLVGEEEGDRKETKRFNKTLTELRRERRQSLIESGRNFKERIQSKEMTEEEARAEIRRRLDDPEERELVATAAGISLEGEQPSVTPGLPKSPNRLRIENVQPSFDRNFIRDRLRNDEE